MPHGTRESMAEFPQAFPPHQGSAGVCESRPTDEIDRSPSFARGASQCDRIAPSFAASNVALQLSPRLVLVDFRCRRARPPERSEPVCRRRAHDRDRPAARHLLRVELLLHNSRCFERPCTLLRKAAASTAPCTPAVTDHSPAPAPWQLQLNFRSTPANRKHKDGEGLPWRPAPAL